MNNEFEMPAPAGDLYEIRFISGARLCLEDPSADLAPEVLKSLEEGQARLVCVRCDGCVDTIIG